MEKGEIIVAKICKFKVDSVWLPFQNMIGKGRKTFVLRQFHIEGFVNQFKIESISPDGKTIIFISESIENIPVGYRQRNHVRV